MVEKIFEIFTRVNRTLQKLKNRIKYSVLLKQFGYGSFICNGVRIRGNPKKISIGDHFQIYENCFFGLSKEGSIKIGNNGLLGVGCYLNASLGEINIGDNVAVGPFCKFFSFSHDYFPGRIYLDQYLTGNIIVENNVFIGTNAVILPGVRIGKNSVIAAGALVNRDVEENSLVGGIPARIIKKINESADNK